MSATEQDVRALEHLAHRIRQDTYGCKPWDAEGTHIVFKRELLGTHLATAVELVVRHAADPDAKTPGAIKRPFLPAASAPPRLGSHPPKKPDECPKHAGQLPAPHCGACATDDVDAWTDTDPQPIDRGDRSWADLCRATLKGTP